MDALWGSGLEGRTGGKDASIFNEKNDLVELEGRGVCVCVCVCVLLMAERASVLSLTHWEGTGILHRGELMKVLGSEP